MTKLRIIFDEPHSATFNMSADRFLMRYAAQTGNLVLRFYKWERPTVTLGQSQKAEDLLDTMRLNKEGIDWINRPTGGRAVFHIDDLTYSITIPLSYDKCGSSISQTYSFVAECLAEGFRLAGVNAELEQTELSGSRMRSESRLPCFISSGRSEILVSGKKLVGSAQKRSSDAVLQHGSIPVSPRFRELPNYQLSSDEEKTAQIAALESGCTCISEINTGLLIDDLASFIADGFAAVSGLNEFVENWSNAEIEIITES